jgi:hypothetical protein
MPVPLNVPALAFVLRPVNAPVRLVSTAHPVKFAQKAFLDPRVKHAPQAVPLAMTEFPVQEDVFHLPLPTQPPVIVLMAFVVPMDNARATQAGPPHPTARSVQFVPPDSSWMGMATVPSARWAASSARMAVVFASLASKALPRMLTTAQSAMQYNR